MTTPSSIVSILRNELGHIVGCDERGGGFKISGETLLAGLELSENDCGVGGAKRIFSVETNQKPQFEHNEHGSVLRPKEINGKSGRSHTRCMPQKRTSSQTHSPVQAPRHTKNLLLDLQPETPEQLGVARQNLSRQGFSSVCTTVV